MREALRAYTLGGVQQDFGEEVKGTIEPGRVADLCVLEADPFEVDPQDIPAIGMAATVPDGRQVFLR